MEGSENIFRGKISFVNFEKEFATIEYLQGNKQKSVNFKTSAADTNKKPQHFRLNDVVSFQLRLSDRGDKMAAYNVKFLHNIELAKLIEKANIENRFSGYLKKVNDNYYVKEADSYIFFPLQLSPWEYPPADTAENEMISFRLVNLDKQNAIKAELFSHFYISEYKKAEMHFEKKYEINATVAKLTPFAIYLDLFNDKLQAKLPLSKEQTTEVKEGDMMKVVITYLTPFKIAVEEVKA